MERAIVECSNCGTPGSVVIDGDKITKAFFLCNCPRPTVDEVNGSNKEVIAGPPVFQEGTRLSP